MGLCVEAMAAGGDAERTGGAVMAGQRTRGDEMGGRATQFDVAVAKCGLAMAGTGATSGMARAELAAVARTAGGDRGWLGVQSDGVAA